MLDSDAQRSRIDADGQSKKVRQKHERLSRQKCFFHTYSPRISIHSPDAHIL